MVIKTQRKEVKNMPRFDGTGPWGYGARTGRGLGPCGYGYRGRRFVSPRNERALLEEEIKELEEEIKILREEMNALEDQKK